MTREEYERANAIAAAYYDGTRPEGHRWLEHRPRNFYQLPMVEQNKMVGMMATLLRSLDQL